MCKELRIERSTFYDWRAKGRAPKCSKLPNGELRIVRRDLDEWFESCRVAVTERAAATSRRESFDVHLWKIRSYKGRRGRTYTVRWTVAGVTHPETFKTQALAESRLAELRTYARNGVAFDVATGLPVPEVRQARAEAAKADELSWYQHALNYVARRRKGLAGNSMRSIADTLATVTPVLLVPGKGRPGDRQIREALYCWAFRGRDDPPEEIAAGPALGGGPLPAAG